jgi:hypothetical protein
MFKKHNGKNNHGSKKTILTTSLSTACKLCSTCAFWAGSREIKSDRQVKVHPYSKGRCRGGGFQHAPMAAMATCDRWQPWPQITLRETAYSMGGGQVG